MVQKNIWPSLVHVLRTVVFDLVDRDGGGTVTKEELGELVRAIRSATADIVLNTDNFYSHALVYNIQSTCCKCAFHFMNGKRNHLRGRSRLMYAIHFERYRSQNGIQLEGDHLGNNEKQWDIGKQSYRKNFV